MNPARPATRLLHLRGDGTRIEKPAGERGDLEDGWYWLDVTDPDEQHAHELAERFSLDRVTREDLTESQFPKFEQIDHYQVLIAHALAPDPDTLRTAELDVLIGDRWVVTVHPEPLPVVDHLYDLIQAGTSPVHGSFHLACSLMELVAEQYLPILDDLDGQILELEEGAIDGDPAVLPSVQALRRDISLLRRVLAPQRRVLDVLLRRESDDDDRRAVRDLNDAVDHHAQLIESLDSAHQMVGTLLDTYRGATAEQMNETMKVLTTFSAIFMPLTLVAGIYGMNFENMPELHHPLGYAGALVLMAVIGVSLWLYFLRRRFIGRPKIRDRAVGVSTGLQRGLRAALSPAGWLDGTKVVRREERDDGEPPT